MVVFKQFSSDQFTGCLAGDGLNEDEEGQRTDGVGTGVEIDCGLVCEQGQFGVGSVVQAQFVIRGSHDSSVWGVSSEWGLG